MAYLDDAKRIAEDCCTKIDAIGEMIEKRGRELLDTKLPEDSGVPAATNMLERSVAVRRFPRELANIIATIEQVEANIADLIERHKDDGANP